MIYIRREDTRDIVLQRSNHKFRLLKSWNWTNLDGPMSSPKFIPIGPTILVEWSNDNEDT